MEPNGRSILDSW